MRRLTSKRLEDLQEGITAKRVTSRSLGPHISAQEIDALVAEVLAWRRVGGNALSAIAEARALLGVDEGD